MAPSGFVPDKRRHSSHVISHEERCPCHLVLPGEFLSCVIFPVGADFFLDQKNLRIGQI